MAVKSAAAMTLGGKRNASPVPAAVPSLFQTALSRSGRTTAEPKGTSSKPISSPAKWVSWRVPAGVPSVLQSWK
jgi:hypothetical protein